jgi:hypothetical protein
MYIFCVVLFDIYNIIYQNNNNIIIFNFSLILWCSDEKSYLCSYFLGAAGRVATVPFLSFSVPRVECDDLS